MANVLYYSLLNPVKLYLPDPDETFHTRHIDDFEFFDTIAPWEEQVDYYQPWQHGDKLRLQLMADFGPHNLQFVDVDGKVIFNVGFTPKLQNVDIPTLWVYEIDFEITDNFIPAGVYRFQLVSGDPDNAPLILQSNKMEVCAKHKHSVLLDYTHPKYHEGVLFQTGIAFQLRVEGAIRFKSPASKDESFEDQSLDETLQNAVPYRLFELIIGDSAGIPPYLIDIINRIFSCPDVLIDGRGYVKPAGNKFEPHEEDGFPLQGWTVELREKVNKSMRTYINEFPVAGRIGIVINSDSKGFGADTGGTVTQVTDIQ